jgi:hypothetical protein
VKLWIGLFVLILLAAGLIWFWNSEWLATDRCLDDGGRWDKTTRSCQFATGDKS